MGDLLPAFRRSRERRVKTGNLIQNNMALWGMLGQPALGPDKNHRTRTFRPVLPHPSIHASIHSFNK